MSHWHLGALCRVLVFILASSSRAVAAPGCVSFQLLSCRTYFQGRGEGPDPSTDTGAGPKLHRLPQPCSPALGCSLVASSSPNHRRCISRSEGRCVPRAQSNTRAAELQL